MNLDVVCAECGHAMVRDAAPGQTLAKPDKAKLEGTITKSLGVLQEDGVYAFFLFQAYFRLRSENRISNQNVSDIIAIRAAQLLRHDGVALLRARGSGEQDDFPALRDLCNQLDELLLTRQILEQSLIYARYHAKPITVA